MQSLTKHVSGKIYIKKAGTKIMNAPFSSTMLALKEEICFDLVVL